MGKMNANYEYYRTFYQVAQCGNITQAAIHLQSNQPNVSRTIKMLEQELGCTLFIRSRSGVQLTPEGERLFAHVRIAMEQLQAGEEELALRNSLQSGSIHIGASEIALHCLLLPALKRFRRLYPQVRIAVNNDTTSQALNSVKNALVDLAVVSGPMDLPDGLKGIPVKKVQDVAVCGSSFSELWNQTLDFQALCAYPLICLSRHTQTRLFYTRLFAEQGLEFHPSVEAATADQILPMVASDLGIGFVPEPFLKHFAPLENVHRLALVNPIPARWLFLVRRNGFALSVAARKLEEMILSEAE